MADESPELGKAEAHTGSVGVCPPGREGVRAGSEARLLATASVGGRREEAMASPG